MKRRAPAPADPAVESLRDFAAWCRAAGVHDSDDARGLPDPTAAIRARRDAWEAWKTARAAHAAEHGWLGGEQTQRIEEIIAAPPVPFDPLAEIAAGRL